LFASIRNCEVEIPENLSSQCKDLLRKLFVADPDKRLGGGARDASDIKEHSWFSGVDWN